MSTDKASVDVPPDPDPSHRIRPGTSAQAQDKVHKLALPREKLVDLLPKTLEEEITPQESWGCLRIAASRVFASETFDAVLGVLIMANLVLVVLETDHEAAEEEVPGWIKFTSSFVSGIYLLELLMRIFTYRAAFFLDASSWLDMTIVSSDAAFMLVDLVIGKGVMPSTSVLRIFKLLRLTRAVKVLTAFPELRLMLKGLKGAMRAVFWGLALLALALCIWGILLVQLVHGTNLRVEKADLYVGCDRCPRAFSSVAQAMLTLTQQLVAGDSWGTVTMPIIEEEPLTALLFGGVLVTVGLTVMNLILAVIVDAAQEARKTTDHELAMLKRTEWDDAKHFLYEQCKTMDVDGSGSLCYAELVNGFDTNEPFRDALDVMDVKRNDLAMVFDILDKDKSGDVDYDEFINELYYFKSHDSHTMLVFIKYYVEDLRVMLAGNLKMMQNNTDPDISSNMAGREAPICAAADVCGSPEPKPQSLQLLSSPQSSQPLPLPQSSQPLPSPRDQSSGSHSPVATTWAPKVEEKLAQAAFVLESGASKYPATGPEAMQHARAVLLDSLEAAKRIFEEAASELRVDQEITPGLSGQEPRRNQGSFHQDIPTVELAPKDGQSGEVRCASFNARAQQLELKLGRVQSRRVMAPCDVSVEVGGRLANERSQPEIQEAACAEPMKVGL